jgi:RNA polymerase sigma-32 factor
MGRKKPERKTTHAVPAEVAPVRAPDASQPAALPTAATGALPAADTFRHYLRQIARFPRLTNEEEHELALRYRDLGDPEAAYRLVTGNLRLVVHIAMEYRRTFLNLLDLILEGNVGLMMAVRKYDPLRGVPFSAYASQWIRAYVLKHLLDHWSIVRVGTTNARRRLFYNLKKERERLDRLGIVAGPKLLASTFDASEQDVIDVSRALSRRDMSLDAPVGDDSTRQVWETIPVASPPPDEAVAQAELRDILREKIAAFAATLDERERYILDHRLVAEDPVTLQAIGDTFSITREAVRLAERKVIAKLRDHLRSELPDLRAFEVSDDAERAPESPVAMERRTRSRSARRKTRSRS